MSGREGHKAMALQRDYVLQLLGTITGCVDTQNMITGNSAEKEKIQLYNVHHTQENIIQLKTEMTESIPETKKYIKENVREFTNDGIQLPDNVCEKKNIESGLCKLNQNNESLSLADASKPYCYGNFLNKSVHGQDEILSNISLTDTSHKQCIPVQDTPPTFTPPPGASLPDATTVGTSPSGAPLPDTPSADNTRNMTESIEDLLKRAREFSQRRIVLHDLKSDSNLENINLKFTQKISSPTAVASSIELDNIQEHSKLLNNNILPTTYVPSVVMQSATNNKSCSPPSNLLPQNNSEPMIVTSSTVTPVESPTAKSFHDEEYRHYNMCSPQVIRDYSQYFVGKNNFTKGCQW